MVRLVAIAADNARHLGADQVKRFRMYERQNLPTDAERCLKFLSHARDLVVIAVGFLALGQEFHATCLQTTPRTMLLIASLETP